MNKEHKITCHHRTEHIHDDYKCRCFCTCFIPENAERTGDKGIIIKEDTSIEDALTKYRDDIFREIEKTIVHNCDGECFDEIKIIFKRLF